MEIDKNTANKYRERAAHARRLSESISDPALRAQMEMVANDYDRMADDIEQGLAEGTISMRFGDRIRRS